MSTSLKDYFHGNRFLYGILTDLFKDYDPPLSNLRQLEEKMFDLSGDEAERVGEDVIAICDYQGCSDLNELDIKYQAWVKSQLEANQQQKPVEKVKPPKMERLPKYKPLKEKATLEYNPLTGEIKQVSNGTESPFNMGWTTQDGVRLIRWQGKPVSFARLCWFLYTGKWAARVERIDKSAGYAIFNLRPVLHTVTL